MVLSQVVPEILRKNYRGAIMPPPRIPIRVKVLVFFLIQKLQRRIEVLQKMEMDQDAFPKMNKLFMSSEESDNEDVEEAGPNRMITKPLPWERKKT